MLMLGVVVALLPLGCGDGRTRRSTTGSFPTRHPAPPYSLEATSRCLRRAGASVERVRPTDTRLQELHDLAQTTSRQAQARGGIVGFAIGRTEADALVLVDALAVPNDPYRIVRRRNAVLMYKRSAADAYTIVAACLRVAES
jgi:hypothetical protein